MRVLLVEDEKLLAEALRSLFEKNGIRADAVYDGVSGLEKALSDVYDVIVLDVMLPEMDGLTVLRTLRKKGRKVPVLLLTARDSLEDKVNGLNSGADDYLVKPFETDELLARVHALGRRPWELFEEDSVCFKDLKLILNTSELLIDGKTVPLTQKEATLLELLIKNAGHPLSKEQILDKVWGSDSGTTENSVELYIHYLRKKLKGSASAIKTKRGTGYMLVEVSQ
ncbi:MAG: response regulator transcription factor [Eubacteriaceae bacterium]|jgi:DNA-binding response OmpR family regulator